MLGYETFGLLGARVRDFLGPGCPEGSLRPEGSRLFGLQMLRRPLKARGYQTFWAPDATGCQGYETFPVGDTTLPQNANAFESHAVFVSYSRAQKGQSTGNPNVCLVAFCTNGSPKTQKSNSASLREPWGKVTLECVSEHF